MPLDPLTVTAIAATGKWMWDSYGKTFTDELAKKLGLARSSRQQQKEWEEATQTYLTKLYEQVNWLHVLGRPEGQPLERIYTDVHVLDKLSAEKRYSLEQLQADFVPRQGWLWRETERRDGLQVAAQQRRLFILGKPGAGKTTFLKHVALQTIKQNGKAKGEKKLPIFVSLKELSDTGQAIVPFIAGQLQRAGFAEAEAFVRELLHGGDAVILFDGLDEVNLEGQQRANLTRAIQHFVEEFDGCRTLVTCRLAANEYALPRFEYVEMADFDQGQQKTFVFRWFQYDKTKRDDCWQALQGTRNQTLRELAQVPMLLSLLCLTFEERHEFPPNRDEIYSEATRALLLKWDTSRSIQRDKVYEALTLKHKERLLAYVAAQTFDAGDYFVKDTRLARLIESYLQGVPGVTDPDGQEVLRQIEAQHGLLVERAHGIYSFSHLTLQEYFTARYIVDNEARGSLGRLMAHVGDDRWWEVFLLTAGLLEDGSDFCHQYLVALGQMVVQDKTLISLLQWAACKSTEARSGVKLPALRAFALYVALARDIALDLDLDSDLDRILNVALELAYNLTHDLAYDFDLDLALAHDRDLDFDLAYDLAHDLAYDLAVSYDLTLLDNLPGSFDGIISHLQAWTKETELADIHQMLQGLVKPKSDASPATWQTFDKQLEKIVLIYWRLEAFWQLAEEKVDLLANYLAASHLLLDCIDMAYLPDREWFENQLLLPPG